MSHLEQLSSYSTCHIAIQLSSHPICHTLYGLSSSPTCYTSYRVFPSHLSHPRTVVFLPCHTSYSCLPILPVTSRTVGFKSYLPHRTVVFPSHLSHLVQLSSYPTRHTPVQLSSHPTCHAPVQLSSSPTLSHIIQGIPISSLKPPYSCLPIPLSHLVQLSSRPTCPLSRLLIFTYPRSARTLPMSAANSSMGNAAWS
jgi:hypothetical protein